MSDILVGSVLKRHEDTEIEWKITNLSTFVEKSTNIKSPFFTFAEYSWYFNLYPKSNRKPGFTSLYINSEEISDFSVEYTIGMKNVNGDVVHLGNGIVGKRSRYSDPSFFKLSELEQRKSELVPSNDLIIIGTLKRITDISDKPKILELSKIKEITELNTLSQNYKSLFINKYNCDATLRVMDKEYKAHKIVLMARSSVFAAMFLHETTEKQTGIVNISDCEPDSFNKFLEFLYCGKLEELSPADALHLYETSNKYNVQDLKTSCVEYLMENITIENVCDIVITADKYDEANLLSAGQKFFNKHVNEILDTSEWDSLVRNKYHLSKKLLKEALSKMKELC